MGHHIVRREFGKPLLRRFSSHDNDLRENRDPIGSSQKVSEAADRRTRYWWQFECLIYHLIENREDQVVLLDSVSTLPSEPDTLIRHFLGCDHQQVEFGLQTPITGPIGGRLQLWEGVCDRCMMAIIPVELDRIFDRVTHDGKYDDGRCQIEYFTVDIMLESFFELLSSSFDIRFLRYYPQNQDNEGLKILEQELYDRDCDLAERAKEFLRLNRLPGPLGHLIQRQNDWYNAHIDEREARWWRPGGVSLRTGVPKWNILDAWRRKITLKQFIHTMSLPFIIFPLMRIKNWFFFDGTYGMGEELDPPSPVASIDLPKHTSRISII